MTKGEVYQTASPLKAGGSLAPSNTVGQSAETFATFAIFCSNSPFAIFCGLLCALLCRQNVE
jgi:hypothetical protein